MKRKFYTPPFNCDNQMEELNVTSLAHRKESAAPLTGERVGLINPSFSYPLAVVLRLRVLQIVCGISAIVMGSVAFIEERQKFNMGLGIPAGSISVLAAAVSIHTSRGLTTSMSGACAGATSVLWVVAACFQLALVVQCFRTILYPSGMEGSTESDDSKPSTKDLIVLACIQIGLAVATLVSAGVCARKEWRAHLDRPVCRRVSEAPAPAGSRAPPARPVEEKDGRVAWLL